MKEFYDRQVERYGPMQDELFNLGTLISVVSEISGSPHLAPFLGGTGRGLFYLSAIVSTIEGVDNIRSGGDPLDAILKSGTEIGIARFALKGGVPGMLVGSFYYYMMTQPKFPTIERPLDDPYYNVMPRDNTNINNYGNGGF